MSSRRNR